MPKPYECVRRSWHSNHHQRIRGSIIQQIFRVVNENHSSGTKKNREWQHKLPKVVFKAEEILYSKANSEAEYLDPETLWDRLNDAIDTIIKKDESMETGEFLPACVEAALNLGCVAVKISRSQRYSNTRSYLTSQIHDPDPRNGLNLNLRNHERPLPVNGEASLNGCSVYPLYYGVQFQTQHPKVFQVADQSTNTTIVGKSVFAKVNEPIRSQVLNYPDTSFTLNGLKKTTFEEPQECDLSLRLGPAPSIEKGLNYVNGVDC
ncbi:uncharacterized protein [Rutidosis leptorrhynchoides]|uniref:uncharacterized protein n=1 Tax=Rutidosis leptorrhynchoides TaxID=125765 RepID=UPI003A999056